MGKAVFKFNFDCGRQGELEGVFISTQEKVDILMEKEIEVYFGEVLGKHSEIYGTIDKGEIEFISDNEEVVNIIEEYGLTSGYNPFNYTSIHYEIEGEEDITDMSIDKIVEILLEKE